MLAGVTNWHMTSHKSNINKKTLFLSPPPFSQRFIDRLLLLPAPLLPFAAAAAIRGGLPPAPAGELHPVRGRGGIVQRRRTASLQRVLQKK